VGKICKTLGSYSVAKSNDMDRRGGGVYVKNLGQGRRKAGKGRRRTVRKCGWQKSCLIRRAWGERGVLANKRLGGGGVCDTFVLVVDRGRECLICSNPGGTKANRGLVVKEKKRFVRWDTLESRAVSFRDVKPEK